jgi:hypothetical protein
MRRPLLADRAWGCALALAACAAGGAPQAPPPATAERAAPAYPGKCALVGLEMVEGSTDRTTGDNASVQLVATYRPGPSAGAGPFSLSFRVKRERVADLRAHLEQHPNVLCGPKPESGSGASYGAEIPPFEGQRGDPIAP